MHRAGFGSLAHKWTKLLDLLMWLESSDCFQSLIINHETALLNALTTGKIPLRGKKQGQYEFCRVDQLLSRESKIWLTSNRVTTYALTQTILSSGTSFLNQMVFEDVEADMNAVETWLLENAIKNDRLVPTSVARHPSKAAVEDLKRYLSEQPNHPIQIKKEVFDALKAGNIRRLGNRCASLSYREFSRIWTESVPDAWTKGGFRRGRQRKSNRRDNRSSY